MKWTSARGLQTLPAEPATLLLHLQYLAGKGKATSTIRTAASAVSAAHRAAGFSGGNPSAHEDVKDFLRGVERGAPPQRQVAVMMPDVISAIAVGHFSVTPSCRCAPCVGLRHAMFKMNEATPGPSAPEAERGQCLGCES